MDMEGNPFDTYTLSVISGPDIDLNKLAGLWATGGTMGLKIDAIIRTADNKEYLMITFVKGLGPCIGECARDEQCASVFYNKKTKICQGHSITHGHSDGAEASNETRYYVQPFGKNYIGDKCVRDTDCVTLNSECRSQACGCLPGYSFSPRTHGCLADCVSYGHGFTEIPNYFISYSNMDDIELLSAEECLEACRSTTEYTCRTLEYGWVSKRCSLQNVTKLHEPDQWFEDRERKYNISHFQRDCA